MNYKTIKPLNKPLKDLTIKEKNAKKYIKYDSEEKKVRRCQQYVRQHSAQQILNHIHDLEDEIFLLKYYELKKYTRRENHALF